MLSNVTAPRGILSTALVLILGLAGPAAAYQPGSGFADPQLDPVFTDLPQNVEILTLDNGLQVVLMPNPAQPMVGIYTQVKAGSAREDARTNGMTHLLEHLLFNGSERYSQEELYAAADRAGAYNNANTSDFFTNLMMVVPAANLAVGLELQAEMLFRSTLPEDKFEKEKGIVLGELAQSRDTPGHFTGTALRLGLFGGSCLELPTLGTTSTIAHMERDDVAAFYRHWYVPNNMILTVAGGFDRDRTLELIERHYGQAAPGTLDDLTLRPAAHIDRTSAVTRRGGDRRVVALSFEAPTYEAPDYFAFWIMTELLRMEGGGILTRALADLTDADRPQLDLWWQQAGAFARLVLEFELPAGADPGLCYRLVQDAVTGAIESGVTGEDILGLVRMTETETLLQREQLRMTGIYIAEPLAVGGTDFFFSTLPRLREVTAEDVTRALANWLVDAPCRAVLIEPAAGTEAEPETGMRMPAGMKMPPGMQMPPAMKAAMGGGDAAEDAAAPPTAPETAPAPLQVDRSVLENGAVLVSQTNADSPLMAIHVAVRGRAMIDRDNAAAGALDLVHRLLEEGVAGCDRTCLAQRLRTLGAVVKLVDDSRIPMDDYYTTGRFSFIRIEVAAENGLETLDLLTEVLQHASFDEAAFERVRQERLTDLGRARTSARSTADALLTTVLLGDHPLALPPEGSVESLEQLDFNQVRVVYRKAFSPENLLLTVVGPRTHAELKQRLEQLLPGRGRPAPGLPPLPVTTAAEALTSSLGGELSAIRLASLFRVQEDDVAALSLLTAVLSDRLAMDLRETRGLSYSVGATVSVSQGIAEFTAWLNPPAARFAEGLDALRGALAGFDPATLTQDELDKMRSARVGRMMMRRLSSMGQAYYLAMAELDGDLGGYLDALGRYDGVTLDALRTVAQRYLAEPVLVEVGVD